MKVFLCGMMAFILLTGCAPKTETSTLESVNNDSSVSSRIESFSVCSSDSSLEKVEEIPIISNPEEVQQNPNVDKSVIGKDIGEICVQVVDKNNIPVINAKITIPSTDKMFMDTVLYTNALGQTKLNWPDAEYWPFTYGQYSAHIKMKRPSGLTPVEEDVILHITHDNAKKAVILMLQNVTTAAELKKAEPHVEITVLDAQGNVPPFSTWLRADVIGAKHFLQDEEFDYEGYIDKDGKVYFSDMPEGEYNLYVLENGGGCIESFTFTVPEYETVTELNFKLSA
ncbi:hypothetical protein EDD70_2839 [Hydrogenoanaerobacterium saccharovorans]|uniref:Uncharacterized protein n=1 Tax=Hydrogenoanaerobacterium saccharovorans TaxID=474960 RepID=A0A1H8E267_9FIRM|nr:hypothetical protein [Hydrogenoanaerobacterium saccharovorans]RPF42096.1 hypothetical protein EDD70_2839 [Hydrogenoanaerobacterium saccharovorans]SEN13540.1 hypothetical protein SAMN05216180_2855 [Hydrogenoanaerobacterium saccharovorans]